MLHERPCHFVCVTFVNIGAKQMLVYCFESEDCMDTP